MDLFPVVNGSSRGAFEEHVAAQLHKNVSVTRIKTSGGEPAPLAPRYIPSAFAYDLTAEEDYNINVDYLRTLCVALLLCCPCCDLLFPSCRRRPHGLCYAEWLGFFTTRCLPIKTQCTLSSPARVTQFSLRSSTSAHVMRLVWV